MALARLNPELPIIKAGWTGNPVSDHGYENHEFPFHPEFSQLLKWQTGKNPEKHLKKDPVAVPAVPVKPFLDAASDGICWVGHATFLIRIGGVLFMTDPIFGAPSALMERFTALPFPKNAPPAPDAVLLSHDHRDHMDEDSLKTLAVSDPGLPIVTGLNMNRLLKSWIPEARITGMGWYQQTVVEGVKVTFLPARHWSRRGLNDTKQRLWGSFYLEGGGRSVYFGADSGYGGHFAEIRDLLGKPDVALLGIGAYKPEWFMGPSHTSPAGAWKAAEDLGAGVLIPMHYGTFDLADEPLADPPDRLRELAADAGSGPDVRFLKPGEAFYLP